MHQTKWPFQENPKFSLWKKTNISKIYSANIKTTFYSFTFPEQHTFPCSDQGIVLQGLHNLGLGFNGLIEMVSFLNTSTAYTNIVKCWSAFVVVILLINTEFNKYRYSSGMHTKSWASRTITFGHLDEFWMFSTGSTMEKIDNLISQKWLDVILPSYMLRGWILLTHMSREREIIC